MLFLIGMGHLRLRRRMRKYNAGTTYQGHNLQSNNPIANDFVHVRDFTLDGHLSKGAEREPILHLTTNTHGSLSLPYSLASRSISLFLHFHVLSSCELSRQFV